MPGFAGQTWFFGGILEATTTASFRPASAFAISCSLWPFP